MGPPNEPADLDPRVVDILRDPVDLAPIPDIGLRSPGGYLALRSGGLSRKNAMEIEHFRNSFRPAVPARKSYARRISALPHPTTTSETLVLDVGCGPYDSISALPGIHVFLDDIMDLYIDELGAGFDGICISARTELMPLRDDSIDVLYSINMIDHVDDMPAALAEMHRVLRPDGRLYCQSYFNSQPLLETEPGVFDRTFYDEYVTPNFEVEYVRTFATGDPSISDDYAMDVIALVLQKATATTFPRKPRDRFESASYRGPQSHISLAIGHLRSGDAEAALPHIDALDDEPFYSLHQQLLRAQHAIVGGDPDSAAAVLRELTELERVRKNPYARLAVNRLENQLVRANNARLLRRRNALQDRLDRLRGT